MTKAKFLLAVGIIAALLSGCTLPTISMVDDPAIPTKAPDGKALVFFHCPFDEVSSGVPWILRNESLVCRLTANSVCCIAVEPGKQYYHLFKGNSHRSLIKTDLTAGKIYDIYMNVERPSFSDGRQVILMYSLEPVKANPEASKDKRALVNEWLKKERPIKPDLNDSATIEKTEEKYRKHNHLVSFDPATDTLGPDDHR